MPLDLSPIADLTRDHFYRLCAANPNHKLERNVHGELMIMSKLEKLLQKLLNDPPELSYEDVYSGFRSSEVSLIAP